MDQTTDLFGIPVPSTDKAFLAFVLCHILIALAAVISGLFAMLTRKSNGIHAKAGRVYYWSMAISFGLIIILSVMRWPHNIHLLTIGILAFFSVHFGKRFAKNKNKSTHTVLMGLSYIFLLTGFYVDNGKNLPLWRLLPQWSFYALPAVVGIPIILRALYRHPLNKGSRTGVA